MLHTKGKGPGVVRAEGPRSASRGSDNKGAGGAQQEITCLEMALQYVAERDWFIFPANLEDGEKKSYKSIDYSGTNWGYTKDVAEIRRNFKKWKKAGVGVPTGRINNVIDIETDTKKGHAKLQSNGASSLEKLETELGALPDTAIFESPSGSVHRLFNYPTHLADVWINPVASKLATGVDVCADGDMIIAPPSVRGDGVYRWVNDLPLADLPEQWIERLIEISTGAGGGNGKTNPYSEYGEFGDKRQQAPIKRITAAAAAIPNEEVSWEEWNNLGMAIWRATDGSGDGFAVFDNWSRKSNKYNAKKTVEKWQKFFTSPPKKIGAGTIFYLASEADSDWEHGDDDVSEPEADVSAPEAETKTDNVTPDLKATKAKLFQSTAEFIGDYVPPDYLIDGLLQRRYIYSFTAPTGTGKTAIALRIAFHVAFGIPVAGREVEKGRVLFFAGENPDDVRSRWIMLCEVMGKKPEEVDVVFMPFTLKLSEKKIRKQIDDKAKEYGPFSLLVVDTSASYYTGDEENDNVQLGDHARMLRTFVDLPGGPTVLVTCHPTKTPNNDNLLPRGGGAFLAEVDGNLVGIKDGGSMVVEINTHGKFRGPDFKPFSFKLVAGQSDKLVDSKGRNIWTIIAEPISDVEQEQLEQAGERNQNELLRCMLDYPGLSVRELAEKLHWLTTNDEPNKNWVNRVLKDLTKQKLTAQKAGNKQYELTDKGKKAAEELPENKYTVYRPLTDEERARSAKSKARYGGVSEEGCGEVIGEKMTRAEELSRHPKG
jgi:hypothetical protein